MGILNRIANDTPRSLRSINSDIPIWLQDIVERLLEKDPDSRPQTASEVAELMGAWLAHIQQPDAVPRPAGGQLRTRAAAGRSSGRPRRWTIAVLGAFLLILATVMIVLQWNKGTLTIECASPDVAVRIMKSDTVYERMTVTPNNHSVRLAAGQYVVEIEGKHDGLKVENGVVTVTRGNTELVRIVEDHTSADRTGYSFENTFHSDLSPPQAGDSSPATTCQEGLVLLQGKWITSNAQGFGVLQRWNDALVSSFTVTGSEFVLELLNPDMSGRRTRLHGTVSVSGKRSPWHIGLGFQLNSPPQTSLLGNCSIEGNRLIINITAANNPRGLIGQVPAVWKFVRESPKHGATKTNSGEGETLEAAVRAFNQQYDVRHPDRGQPTPTVSELADHRYNFRQHTNDQPPLTVSELVAAVRWAMMNKKDYSPEMVSGLECLLENHQLPAGWTIRHMSQGGPNPASTFQCWFIDLSTAKGSSIVIRRRILRQPSRYDDLAAETQPTNIEPNAIPLAAAIREFNEAHMHDAIGKDQPPLTEDEVVAAIRSWQYHRNDAPVTNAEFEAFQQIANTRSLPKGFQFELLTDFEPGDGYRYRIWSVRIVMQRTAKPGWTYAFEIRRQYVSCSPIQDESTAWGPAAANGLQAAVQFSPAGKQYKMGQRIAVRFLLRNTSDKSCDMSVPNLMTHAYYSEIHVTDSDGKDIPLRKDTDPSVPVGWRKVQLPPKGMLSIDGLPISIGEVSHDQDVETAICATPGQSCRVSFTLPNFAEPHGEPLKTGELKFVVVLDSDR